MIGFHLINFNTLYESHGMYVYPINDRFTNITPLLHQLSKNTLISVPKPCSFIFFQILEPTFIHFHQNEILGNIVNIKMKLLNICENFL